ncbi:hypothetical protein HPB52_011702 [Rhipicephalus sanguineus]|uniref:Carboxylesterase type B domain-containing protein n=1 Tax=Rhipicephalus sanguineus TaxID=34632 RepID=A0A9D4PFC2_RHISA|nr:hypothetical protein HPB52_011702 [Rhipicephalus sanguineus]
MATSVITLACLLATVFTATAHDTLVERQTTEGTVRGKVVRVMDKPVEQYLGIPFAEPPVAEHAMLKGNLTFTEDCLYLNVWAPVAATDSGSRPVLVWIYGGAFTFGSANTPIYNAVWLAALGDVVVVSMNYRLGI